MARGLPLAQLRALSMVLMHLAFLPWGNRQPKPREAVHPLRSHSKLGAGSVLLWSAMLESSYHLRLLQRPSVVVHVLEKSP